MSNQDIIGLISFDECAYHFPWAAQVAERLVCISDNVRDHVLRVTDLTALQVCRVHISLPELPVSLEHEAVRALMNRLGLTAGRYLIYPANVWPQNQHNMLLTAAGIYFSRHPDSDLILVFTGINDDERSRMLRLATEQMGLAERICFPLFQSEGDLAALIGNARALIFPSLTESYGMPVLEAIAQGMPVLTASSSVPQIVGDTSSLLFDPRKHDEIVRAIEAIETDIALADHLAASGQRRAQARGDAASMGAEYLAIFDEVISFEYSLPRKLKRLMQRAMLSKADDNKLWFRYQFMTYIIIITTLSVEYIFNASYQKLMIMHRELYGNMQILRLYLSRRMPVLRVLVRWVRERT